MCVLFVFVYDLLLLLDVSVLNLPKTSCTVVFRTYVRIVGTTVGVLAAEKAIRENGACAHTLNDENWGTKASDVTPNW